MHVLKLVSLFLLFQGTCTKVLNCDAVAEQLEVFQKTIEKIDPFEQTFETCKISFEIIKKHVHIQQMRLMHEEILKNCYRVKQHTPAPKQAS